jgi:predicted HicB family RNase H-like nuclease
METIKYKDFVGSVEVSIKDKCIHGKILFINDLVTYEANSPDKIENEFKAAVDDYIETCKDLEIEPLKSFNGAFNVRIGPELHQKVALYAVQNDSKINPVVKKAIEEYLNKPNQGPEIHNHTHNFYIEGQLIDFEDEEKDHESADIISFEKLREA